VAVAAFGDGAVNQGSVHEALNFAAVYRLPALFLIENNGYSELTPIATMVRSDRLYSRAGSYGIDGVRVDGNDVGKVRATVAEAASHARRGEGPVVIEATTQRLVGHYFGDAQQYRPSGEIEQAQRDEPITRITRELTDRDPAAAELEEIRRTTLDEVNVAAAAALSAPLADPATIKEHLYA
jgi:TPP-dependent pyruvate/acetoin dehydrogenase alpha subunit